jgi:glycosyltransferase involved in cell wall biosynthesis
LPDEAAGVRYDGPTPPGGDAPMQVSVVVPTYNRREMVLRTIATLLRQNFPADDYEIVVVVDGSTDGTAETLERLGTGGRLRVVEQENRGLAGARNTGIRASCGELLIFVDDDMECEPELVGEHLRAHTAHSETGGSEVPDEIAALGAIYVSPENPRNLAAEYFNRGLGAPYLRQRDHPGEPWPENAWSFGNTSVRRTVLERVGSFDERFRMREDGELGLRLRAAGVRQRFVGEATAYQWCAKSASELVRDAEAFAEADLLFLRTYPEAMPHDFLLNLRGESQRKRRLRRLLLAHPALADLALAPLCALGEALPAVRPLRMAAVRALLLRCGLHWLHRLCSLSGMTLEEWMQHGVE